MWDHLHLITMMTPIHIHLTLLTSEIVIFIKVMPKEGCDPSFGMTSKSLRDLLALHGPNDYYELVVIVCLLHLVILSAFVKVLFFVMVTFQSNNFSVEAAI